MTYHSALDAGRLAYAQGTSLVFDGTVVVPAWSCARSASQSGVGFLLFATYVRNHKVVSDAVGVSIDCTNGAAVTKVDTELGGAATFPEGQGHNNEIKVGDKVELSIGVKAQHSTIRLDDVTHPALITATAPGGKPDYVSATAAAIYSGPTQLPIPSFGSATYSGLLVDEKPLGDLTRYIYDLVFGKKVEVAPGPIQHGTTFILTAHVP
ncbi:MAG: hypothetical protein ACYCUG_05240 [Acidimicrobiales bacterium]